MSFTRLLIHTCNIMSKTYSLVGYEKTNDWALLVASVPCRRDSDVGTRINDAGIRTNIDDDIFYFNPGVPIHRGHRIVFDGMNFDVIKVNSVYDSQVLHHLEVVARLIDNN